MNDFPILEEDYWTALEILTGEIGSIKECVTQRVPWYPADAGQFDWAMRIYRNFHHLLSFPWPEPGEVPSIQGRYFIPTEKEKVKIHWFIDNFGGEEEDPWVKEMVELAKDVLEEVR